LGSDTGRGAALRFWHAYDRSPRPWTQASLVPAWSIDAPSIPAAGGQLRLRDLIENVVESEVEAFRARAEERAFLRVLSPAEIEDGAARGKIDMGGREQNAEVDVESAKSVALQAFEDGLYLVLINEAEIKELNAPIELDAESKVVFLRLAFLAGA
jgi:hypothetical protein